MKALQTRITAGYTIMEVLVAALAGLTLVGVCFSFMQSTGMLFAKSSSINYSHQSSRVSLERLSDSLQRANTRPTVIDTAGVATTSPAAGVAFDNLLGAPYVVTHPGGTGLASSATGITVTRSTAARSAPPIPQVGDSVLIDATGTPVRALISSVSIGAIDTVNQRQSFTLGFSAALGKAVTWKSTEPRTAMLVRRQAFIVMPSNGKNELRFFPNFEPIPTLTNPANYVVVSDQIGTTTVESKPFTKVVSGADMYVSANLAARSGEYANYLSKRQATGFNTYSRLTAVLSSRQRPRQ